MSQAEKASSASAPRMRRCDGTALVACLRAAAEWLDIHSERINALNVFPVPDGDTGTNMSLTLRAAVQAAQREQSTRIADLTRSAARGALLGARGNSGVILSQLIRGFAQALESCEESLTASALATAFAEAARVAYRGVSKPVEGTLLTVAREVGVAAQAASQQGDGVSAILERCVRAAEQAVERTPEQLEVLRRAQVVDAGGEGYRVLLEGAWMYVTNQRAEMAAATQPGGALARARVEEEAPFGFCTELVLSEPRADVDEIRQVMESLGQSVIVVGDGGLVRIHLHVLRPGLVLEYAVDQGQVQHVKIENMELQHRGFVASHTTTEGLSKIGVVAIASGDGFKELLGSMGAAAIVEGGQTRNPSVQDILVSVNGAAFEELVILPNNKNVILTASHVRGLTARRVEVVPTETIVQGIAAMLAFNYLDDLDTNVSRMRDASERVRTIEVTTAVRDAEVNGVPVARGHALAVLDGEVAASGPDVCAVVDAALEQANAAGSEVVTIYHGANVTKEDAERLLAYLRERHAGPEWELALGGQPHYPFIISIE